MEGQFGAGVGQCEPTGRARQPFLALAERRVPPYAGRRCGSASSSRLTDHLPRLRAIEENVANLPYERFCRDQGVFGDASEVLDRLAAARDEFGLSQIICWFDQGSRLARDEVEDAMRQFAEQVMPKLG